jgi:hypothetical protein
MSEATQRPAVIAAADLSEETHITLYADGSALLEFVAGDGEVGAAQLTADEVARLRALLLAHGRA